MGREAGDAGLGAQGAAGQVALSSRAGEFKFEPSLEGWEGGTQAEGQREAWREAGTQGTEGASAGRLLPGEVSIPERRLPLTEAAGG